MKKLLMTCAALSGLALSSAGYAADLAVRPAPVVAPAAPWTGCYIGIHAGAGWGDKWWADRNLTDNVSYPTSGWVRWRAAWLQLPDRPARCGRRRNLVVDQ